MGWGPGRNAAVRGHESGVSKHRAFLTSQVGRCSMWVIEAARVPGIMQRVPPMRLDLPVGKSPEGQFLSSKKRPVDAIHAVHGWCNGPHQDEGAGVDFARLVCPLSTFS